LDQLRRKYDGGRDHRAEQGAPAGFVKTGHCTVSLGQGAAFQLKIWHLSLFASKHVHP
jgi:hypothetical protein